MLHQSLQHCMYKANTSTSARTLVDDPRTPRLKEVISCRDEAALCPDLLDSMKNCCSFLPMDFDIFLVPSTME